VLYGCAPSVIRPKPYTVWCLVVYSVSAYRRYTRCKPNSGSVNRSSWFSAERSAVRSIYKTHWHVLYTWLRYFQRLVSQLERLSADAAEHWLSRPCPRDRATDTWRKEKSDFLLSSLNASGHVTHYGYPSAIPKRYVKNVEIIFILINFHRKTQWLR
jgi:hypothetical protein